MEERRTHFSQEELREIKEVLYIPLTKEIYNTRINPSDDTSRKRNECQRDYARIIYSSSFRRLQGKMQLLGVESDKFFRNRLTHSIEVAQIARELAENIGHDITLIDAKHPNVYRDDLYIVEACALAHDIGNPPFGHKGERVLHELCKNGCGFEGNAQTLRVLMDLEKKFPDFGGLNLMLRTLLGVTKYFVKYTGSSSDIEKFIYSDTYDIIKEYIESDKVAPRTLDVQIVDLSDEIAYAAHDLEDALSLGLFTIDDLLYEFRLLDDKKYPNAFKSLSELVKEARKYGELAHRFKSSEEYSHLFRKDLTANIVHSLICDIHLIEVTPEDIKKTGTMFQKELRFQTLSGLAKGLKKVTFNCINRKDHVQLYEAQGEKIIKGLYEVLISNDKYLPVELRFNENEESSVKQRKVVDYISGMMDSFATSTYIKFFGKDSLDKIYIEKVTP